MRDDHMSITLAPAVAPNGTEFTKESVHEASNVAREAIMAAHNGNLSAATWHASQLVVRVGMDRARLLLGRHAKPLIDGVVS